MTTPELDDRARFFRWPFGSWLTGKGLPVMSANQIRLRLFAFLLLVGVVIAGLIGWVTWREHSLAMSAAASITRNLAHSLSQHAARAVESVDITLQFVQSRLRDDDIRTASREDMHRLLRDLDNPSPVMRLLAVFDENGHNRLDSRSVPALQLDISDRLHFHIHKQDAQIGLYISPPLRSLITGQWSIFLTRRLDHSDGRFAGVVLAVLDSEYFQPFYDSIDLGDQGAITVFRTDGTVMMRKPLDDDLIGRMLPDAELFTRQLPSAPAGTYQGNSAFQGISRIFSYRRVEALPLVVSVSMALDDVLAVWRANAIRDGLAGLAIFTVLTVLAMLMAISLRKREEAKAATLRAARQLADKNVILDALLSELPDGVRLLDHDLHLIAWNDRFFDIMSLDEVKVLSDANPQKAILRQLIERGEYGEGTLEELTARREAIITSGKSVSYRRRLVTGKWIEYRGTPMPDGGNLAVVRDVTREVDRETEITDANDKLGQQAAELAALAVQLSAVHQTAEEARRVAEGAKFAAEEANRSKSEFLTGMSHELRTPLNSILGFSQIIQSVDFGDQAISRYRTYAGNIRQAGDHLLSLINDLLDLAKVEAGRMELQEEVAELGHILKAVGTMSRERAHDAGIELIIETDREPVIVRADVLKLKQSLINVVSNAIKFTPAGGTVHVRVERVEDGVDISVTDTGIGIKPEDIPKVFDRFGQIDGGLTRKHKGTGLGMPLTRTLMELQGGTVHLRSELGKGTRVMLHLPSGRLVG